MALELALGQRPLLMAIVNVTPDSFFDGGAFFDRDKAVAQGRRLVDEGADIVDVGGESTRPGATKVPVDDEIARVAPVIHALSAEISVPISVDTYNARTAKAALEAGATIVNDVWGLQRDPDMAHVVADSGARCVLMHNRAHDLAPVADIQDELRDFFHRSLDLAASAGVRRERIILDPGIGFGKTPQQNLLLATELTWLKREFDLPILIGASRKRIVAHLIGDAARDRLSGTVALHTAAALAGADIIRAHDAAAHRDALRVVAAVKTQRASTTACL